MSQKRTRGVGILMIMLRDVHSRKHSGSSLEGAWFVAITTKKAQFYGCHSTVALEITSQSIPFVARGLLGGNVSTLLGLCMFCSKQPNSNSIGLCCLLFASGWVGFLPQAAGMCPGIGIGSLPWRCFAQALGFWASVPCAIEVWVCVGGLCYSAGTNAFQNSRALIYLGWFAFCFRLLVRV